MSFPTSIEHGTNNLCFSAYRYIKLQPNVFGFPRGCFGNRIVTFVSSHSTSGSRRKRHQFDGMFLYDSKYIVNILFVVPIHPLPHQCRTSIPKFSTCRQKSLKHVGFTNVVVLGAGVILLYPCIMKHLIVKT